MDRVKLCICTPCYGGMVTSQYMLSLFATSAELRNRGIEHSLNLGPGDSLITRARNFLVSRALANPAWTHIMFIDSDISWEPEAVVRLLYSEKDVCCGCYPCKTLPLTYPMNFLGPRLTPCPETGYVEIAEAPTGFLMIRREVFSRMAAAYPELKCQFHGDQSPEELANSYSLFDCITVNGRYLSEDYAFCHRWRAIGGKVWLDPQIQLTHHGSFAYTGRPADLFTKLPK